MAFYHVGVSFCLKGHCPMVSPTNSNNPAMTPEEAFSILHRLHDAVGYHLYDVSATEEEQALRKQILNAFRALCITVHGEAPLGCMPSLCDVCYLRYTPIANPLVSLKEGLVRSKSPCTECLEQLKAEG